MKRPLLFILTFLIFGILIYYFLSKIYIKFILFFVLLFLSLYLSKIYKLKFPKYLVLFSLLGYFLMYLNNIPYTLSENQEINAIGYVNSIEKTSNNKYKLNYIIYYERKVKKGDRG